ncbi:MAG: hypothetical protein ABIJ82_03380 [Patescibacteria group bacterium]
MFISKRPLSGKVVAVVLTTFVSLLSIFFLVLNKKYTAISNPTLSEKLSSEDSNILGTESAAKIVLYDNDGVVVGTSLNDNLKPQVDITVDDKTISKDIPTSSKTSVTISNINTFFINGWMKFIDILSTILDQIIS